MGIISGEAVGFFLGMEVGGSGDDGEGFLTARGSLGLSSVAFGDVIGFPVFFLGREVDGSGILFNSSLLISANSAAIRLRSGVHPYRFKLRGAASGAGPYDTVLASPGRGRYGEPWSRLPWVDDGAERLSRSTVR